jgi:TolA-binding protein
MRNFSWPRTLLLLFFLLLSHTALLAQKTLVDTDPVALFRKAKELYDDKHYASAEEGFKQYLETRDQNVELRADASYYIAISAMELYQDDAEGLLYNFTINFPEHPKARLVNFYLGRFEFKQKQYAKAAETFEKVDASDLSSDQVSEYEFMAGYSYFQAKQMDKAKQHLAKAKDMPGEYNALASYYYGFICYNQGDYKSALAEFNKIKDDSKFKTVVPVYLAQIYLLQGDNEKVIQYGEDALKNNETEQIDQIKLYVAEAYFLQKNYAKAVEYYKSYHGGLTPHHLYQLGYASMMTNQYADAVQAFNGIEIKEDSLGQNVSYNLGTAYLKTGEKEKARNAFSFASNLKFIPAVQQMSLFYYAKLSYDLNFEKEAIDAFKQYISKYPESKHANDARELLSQILLSSSNPKEALDVMESIPNRNSKLNEAYQKILYEYGLQLFNDKQYQDALQYFGKSLQQPVDRTVKALAYFWAGESRFRLGDYGAALTNYKNFLYVAESQSTPYYSLAFYNIGYCYFKTQDYINARTYFNKYLDAESGSKHVARYTDAVLRAADCNFALKNYPSAQSGYQDVINSHAPETDYALYQKGLILGLQGKNDDKISTLRTLAKSYPNSPLLDDALYGVGETYNNMGEFQQAIKEFQSLNYNYPKNPYYLSAMLNIGQAYINLEQDEKAIPIFKFILSKYPYTAEAKQAMKAIENSYIDRGLTDSLQNFYTTLPNGKMLVTSQDSVLYASAFSNVKNNDCNAAIKSLSKYLNSYPNGYFSADANFFLADCEHKTGRDEAALGHYNNVIAKSPNSYVERALIVNAEIYYKQKNYDMAYRRYQQLEEIANNKQNVLLALNGELRASFFLNQYDKTIDVAGKLLNLAYADDASKKAARFYQAKSQLELNQVEQALPTFIQVYKDDKSEIGAEAMYDVAYIYFTQGKYKDAQDIIFSLKDRYASYDYWRAKAFILLSDIFVKTGDDFQAKSTLQSIIENYEGADLVKIAKDKLNEIKERQKNNPKGGDQQNKEKSNDEDNNDLQK